MQAKPDLLFHWVETEVQRGLSSPPGHRELDSHLRQESDISALSSVIKFRNALFLFSCSLLTF